VRVFLDTNVLVSAFASRGLCAELFELVLLEHELIAGQNVLRELAKALRQKIKLPTARTEEIVDFVAGEAAQTVDEVAAITAAKVDADDALVLGEALAGQAAIFVTGDAALLKIAVVESLQIVSPRQFWEVLRSGKGSK
jgi:putative PIN family toxin of toxin-antitoxin system